MEPKLPTPNSSHESAPLNSPVSLESFPLPPHPEVGIHETERPLEQQAEAVPAVSAAPALPTPVVAPTSPTSAGVGITPVVPLTDDMPTVAGDDDLIEKEWVDKAKKIIAETRADPHLREKQVTKLQADYLRKRYGKELGESE